MAYRRPMTWFGRSLCRKLSSIAIAFSITSCTVNLAVQDPQKTYEQGTQALVTGDYDRAIAKLSQVIVKTPEFAEAHVNRGVAYDGLGAPEKAIADYSQAIALDPQLFDAYFNRGNSQANLANWELARADFDEALALRPDSGEAYGNRAIAQLKLGDRAGAEADLQMAIAQFEANGNEAAQKQAEQQLAELLGD